MLLKQYRIKLTFEAAHYLHLPHYKGPQNWHSHTYHVEFYIAVPKDLNDCGIGIDFKELKEKLTAILPDHYKRLNDIEENPTVENLVEYLYYKAAMQFPMKVKKVVLWETESNGVEFSNN